MLGGPQVVVVQEKLNSLSISLINMIGMVSLQTNKRRYYSMLMIIVHDDDNIATSKTFKRDCTYEVQTIITMWHSRGRSTLIYLSRRRI